MFCPKCGTNNAENSAFCKSFGTPLSVGTPAKHVSTPSARAATKPAAHATPTAHGARAEAQEWQQPQPQQRTVARPVQEGCLAAAWRDITSSPGWIKQILILCLVGCVPILNFAIEGYAIRWGRSLSFGKRDSLPSQIFTKKEISTGFFAILVKIAMFSVLILLGLIAALLLASIFGIIGPGAAAIVIFLVAVIALIAGLVLVGPFVDASIMRMSVVGYLESAFNFPKTLKAFAKAPGGAIAASLVPPVLVGVVEGLLTLIVGLFVAVASRAWMSSYYGYGSYGYGYSYMDPTMLYEQIVQGAFAILLVYLILWIVASMLNTFSSLFAYRAMGHWAARTAPEWASEAEELSGE